MQDKKTEETVIHAEEEMSADEIPEVGAPDDTRTQPEPEIEPEPEPEPDPVMKPKRKVNRTKAQEDGLKKAQEVRKKNIEMRKAEKLVAAQELVKEKKQPEPKKELLPPAPPVSVGSSLKDIKEMMEILELKKKVQESDDSDDEIERLEKRLERKKNMRKKRQEREKEPQLARNTINTPPKKMLGFI